MSAETERLKVLTAGVLSLVLALGIARFAYTPMLPLMQQQAGLGIFEGGWLAAINYMGYLSGAVIASLISDLHLKDRLYRIGLVVAVVTTAGMGLTESVWLWGLLRFLAGLSSAAGLLLGSGLILNWLLRHDFRSELGVHFGGVGLGILFCSLAVELMTRHFSWSEQWLLFTMAGALILIPAWAWLPAPDTTNFSRGGQELVDNPPGKGFVRLFMAAYFCAGVGYVVSATFLVAIVDQLPGLEGKGAWAFMMVGLAATPACVIWDRIARRVGDFNALLWTFLLQILGIMLPVLATGLVPTIIGAMLFGGTFIGSVSLVLTIAGRYYPTKPAKMMGKMTVSYGVAQILAPAITGVLAEQSGSYADGLYLAAAVMVVGSMMMYRLKVLADRDRAADACNSTI
jgi:MFS family permease